MKVSNNHRIVFGLAICLAPWHAQSAPVQFSDTGHYYEVIPTATSWDVANLSTQASSFNGVTGHLATISNAQENTFVASIVNLQSAWLGGFQPSGSAEPNGNWQWVTGEPWNFTNWGLGEPNDDLASILGPENSLILYTPTGDWNDGHGWIPEQSYVIEYDVATVSEPNTISLFVVLMFVLVGIMKDKIRSA